PPKSEDYSNASSRNIWPRNSCYWTNWDTCRSPAAATGPIDLLFPTHQATKIVALPLQTGVCQRTAKELGCEPQDAGDRLYSGTKPEPCEALNKPQKEFSDRQSPG